MKLEEELKEISPFLLENKAKKEGFNVPTHYFSNMQLELMQQLKTEMPTIAAPVVSPTIEVSWIERLKTWFRPSYGLAGAVAVAIGIFVVYQPNFSANATDATIAKNEAIQPSNDTNNIIPNPVAENTEEPIIEIKHSTKTQAVYQKITSNEVETYIKENMEEFNTEHIIATHAEDLAAIELSDNTNFDDNSIQKYLEENIEDLEEEDLKD